MTTNKKAVQLSLIFIGLFLILATYFFYPKFLKEKIAKNNPNKIDLAESDITDNEDRNLFENVEYKGIYDINKPFTVKAEKALILEENSELVYMTNMRVTLEMNDKRIIIITSDSGRYDKTTYDCFFENNVKAIDGRTTVFADNMDLLASESNAAVYNNVFLTNDEGSLRADKIYYDFDAEYYQVSMFSDEKVKIKLIK